MGVEGQLRLGDPGGLFSRDQLHGRLFCPAGNRQLDDSCLKPYRFAWRRRVNEDNIDLKPQTSSDSARPYRIGLRMKAITTAGAEAWGWSLRQRPNRERCAALRPQGFPLTGGVCSAASTPGNRPFFMAGRALLVQHECAPSTARAHSAGANSAGGTATIPPPGTLRL